MKNTRWFCKQEFIFALSLVYQNFLRLPIFFFPKIQTVLMLIFNLLFIFFIIVCNGRKNSVNQKTVLLSFFIIFLFCIDFGFRYNNKLPLYLKYSVTNGLIPVLLMKNVRDIKSVIKYGLYMSLMLFLLYFWVPFNNYIFFSDYMDFGFNYTLYIFCFIFMYRKIISDKKLLIFELLIIIETALFGNKGSILTIFLIILIYNIFLDNKLKSNILKHVILFIILLFVFNYIGNILNYTNTLLLKNNITSYSLKTMIRVINNTSDGLSGRNIIWTNAKNYYEKYPIFGNGIGSFHSDYGYYTHNIFLELLTSFGIVGIICFTIILLKKILNIIFEKNKEFKIISIIIIISSIVPLCFSMYMAMWTPFWIMLYYSSKKLHKMKESENNE